MPNKNSSITIEVYRSGSTWMFTGAGNLSANGDLVVGGKGAVQIEFKRKPGETWRFVEPFILFGPSGTAKNQSSIAGVLVTNSTGVAAIKVEDTNNQGLNTAAFYDYALYTNLGVIDPMIVNDGGP